MKLASNSSVVKSTTKAGIIELIKQLVPPGSPEPQDPAIIADLQTLTAKLIEAYKAYGL